MKKFNSQDKEIKAGDIFALKTNDDKYVPGVVIRVSNNNCNLGSASTGLLIYMFSEIKKNLEEININKLNSENLLTKPFFVAEELWGNGYAHTFDNVDLSQIGVFKNHYFIDQDFLSKEKFIVDECGNKVDLPVNTTENFGQWCILTLDGLEKKINENI